MAVQLNEFKGLKFDWDSYQAEAIDDAIVDFSKEIAMDLIDLGVQIDFAVPMRDGGVQLEFNWQDYECELEIHPSRQLELLVYDKLDLLKKLSVSATHPLPQILHNMKLA